MRTGWLLAVVVAVLPAQESDTLRVTIAMHDTPLVEALFRLRHEARLPLAWRGDLLPVGQRVTLSARAEPWAPVLERVLRGSGLSAVRTASGNILLLPTGASPALHEATAVLAVGVVELDQLIVTGSATGPAPGREQPTAVTVVHEADLRASPHRRLADQVRAFLPGAVSWDRGGAGPPPALGGVRGVASFIARAPKVYVDGIELASPELFTLLDARAIAGLELVHGPQGAALYGPDALNGVMQVVTDHGPQRGGRTGPRGALVGGGLDRAGAGRATWGEAALGVAGRSGGGTGSLLLARTRVDGDPGVLAEGWRAHGGGQVTTGALTVRASGWLADHDAPLERLVPATGAFLAREVPSR